MSWLDNYYPASWRGVPFFVDEHEWNSGRRIASHEYALQDTPSTEDMGRNQRKYQLKAYVIANLITQDYFAARDALRAACELQGVGTLVHPYLGSLRVRLTTVKMVESKDRGGMATFDLAFVESGRSPTPAQAANTAGTLLAGIQSALGTLMAAYAIGSAIADRPSILFGLASQAFGSLAGGLLGLPPSVAGQLGLMCAQITANLLVGPAQITSTITGLTGDPLAVAVTDAFTVAANAVVDAQAVSVGAVDPIIGQAATALTMATDPTLGLAAFATWGAALPPPAGLQVAVQQQVQQQIIDLVQGAAVLAVAQIYAGITWQTSTAAQAAKNALAAFLDSQLATAAAGGNSALFNAWMTIRAQAVADLTQRALALPSIVNYRTDSSLPAPALAQLLYQDGRQWQFLAALNGAIHPGFMPAAGIALSQLPGRGAQ